MRVRFVGCGDAFGSGGRYQTSIEVTAPGVALLVDLGATAWLGLKRLGADLDAYDALLFTHFHGDHFGGLPYFLLDADFVTRRRRPLTIAGPPGVRAACRALMQASYPGHVDPPGRGYEIRWQEIAPRQTVALAGAEVTAFAMRHDPALAHCLGYRVAAGGRVFAFSGDTNWTEELLPLGRGADLLAVECYTRARDIAVHLNYATLAPRIADIGARRVVLTHMGADILDNPGEIALPMAEDGLTIEL